MLRKVKGRGNGGHLSSYAMPFGDGFSHSLQTLEL